EFWRRWHISLSSWLKDYLYISLGGNRKGRFRTYVNLLITMLLGGLWHGAALRFVVWGGLHGAGLAPHKLTMHLAPGFKPMGSQMPRWRRIIGILFTFSFVCATWVFFRAESMEVAKQIFVQIFTAFHPEIFLDFLAGYRWVVLLMAVGYALHFTSARIEARTLQLVQRMPIFVYALMMTGLIWLIMQLKNGDVQPFIYFQF
ncbi:MAG: MBOAT family protein, partial [Rikenella sp.]|nr:MBOAT family protein [Rikenella sp.]